MRQLSQQKEVLFNYILSNELENRKIAEALQQQVTQVLSSAHLKINLYEEHLTNIEGRENIAMVRELIKKSIHEINKLYLALFPLVLVDLGLLPAIKELFREFRKSKLLIKIKHIDLGAGRTISNDLNVYKIISILLKTVKENIKNSSIEFSLIKNDDTLIISLKDIGKNQNFSSLLSLSKCDFMRVFIIFIERLKLINGSYSIKSHPDKNKEIVVKIPVISF
jgi:two-component system, NarL family, sensor histidine kinase DegS